MKKIAVLLLIAALLSLGMAAACAEADLTLLVYMCGSDMSDAACIDLYEMALAETGDDVNIVILAGGSSEWEYEEIEGDTRNLITIRDGDFESIEDWGWASMGDGDSLLEFLEYGLSEYPADRTMVVLWDHGAGSEGGICFDDTGDGDDSLTLVEINDALYGLQEELGDFHIDILGCDACMMATYEMAAMLSNYDIGYMIASEETEPGNGWDYTPWLKAIDKNPGLSTEELCRQIIDAYMKSGQKEAPDDYLTISAVDLTQFGPLQAAMEKMGKALLGELENGNISDVRRGRSRMYTFGSYVDGSWDMVDLGAMLDAYAQFDQSGAAEARKALSKAVLISRQYGNLPACSGLSVLIPQDTKNEFEQYSDGMDLSFYIPNWTGFVKAYARQLTGGGHHSFAASAPQEITGTGFLSMLSSIFAEPEKELSWNGDGYEETEQTEIPITASEGDYAFSASIPAEDLRYLDYVEGMLLMDISDDEMEGYIDLGLMQNNVIDWKKGEIYSLFDGTWPILGDQLVPLYDQINNAYGRRSLIPVKLNGSYTYLVVEFAAGGTEGRVIGANAGYDENGLPIRTTTRLKAGDSVIPVYTMYVAGEDDEDYEEMEFEGDEFRWQDGMTVTFEELGDDGEKLEMVFCFVLNDVFGEYDMTDFISFEV